MQADLSTFTWHSLHRPCAELQGQSTKMQQVQDGDLERKGSLDKSWRVYYPRPKPRDTDVMQTWGVTVDESAECTAPAGTVHAVLKAE